MNNFASWKRVEAVLKRLGQLSENKDIFIQRTKLALKKYYWDKLTTDVSKRKLMKPLFDVDEYVYEAYNANLDRAKTSLYAGTIFLDSILKETGRKFTSDVKEANILFDIGKRLANLIWDELNAPKTEPPIRERVFHGLVDSLLEET